MVWDHRGLRPVVDVSDQGANTVIGDRSFSNDPPR